MCESGYCRDCRESANQQRDHVPGGRFTQSPNMRINPYENTGRREAEENERSEYERLKRKYE